MPIAAKLNASEFGATPDVTVFVLVCAGVIVLRVVEPQRPRPFKVPMVWVVAPLGMAACVFVMIGLPREAWERFFVWLVVGIALYAAFGYRHSRLRAR